MTFELMYTLCLWFVLSIFYNINIDSSASHLGIASMAPTTRAMAFSRQTNFLDLPLEIREMVYAYFPHQAWISINQAPSKLKQPALAFVSHQIREECLAYFYKNNKFVLDLRGWKDASYPKLWKPADIFESWVRAIGDGNAGHLRSLTFFAANFRVVVKISGELPVTINARLRVNTKSVDLADYVPNDYNFATATQRVTSAFAIVVKDIEVTAHREARQLTAADINRLKTAVADLQPFLCSRMGLGFLGAVLRRDNMHEDDWPDRSEHLERCDDCGYLRYSKT